MRVVCKICFYYLFVFSATVLSPVETIIYSVCILCPLPPRQKNAVAIAGIAGYLFSLCIHAARGEPWSPKPHPLVHSYTVVYVLPNMFVPMVEKDGCGTRSRLLKLYPVTPLSAATLSAAAFSAGSRRYPTQTSTFCASTRAALSSSRALRALRALTRAARASARAALSSSRA